MPLRGMSFKATKGNVCVCIPKREKFRFAVKGNICVCIPKREKFRFAVKGNICACIPKREKFRCAVKENSGKLTEHNYVMDRLAMEHINYSDEQGGPAYSTPRVT